MRSEPSAMDASFQSIADSSPVAIIVGDADRIVYVNAAALRLLQAEDTSELLDQSLIAFIPAELLERMRDGMQRDDKPTGWLPHRWRRRDGREIDVEAAAGPAPWQGRPAVQVLAREVTAQQLDLQSQQEVADRLEHLVAQRSAELHNQKSLLQSILDTVLGAVISIDAQGTIKSVNRATQRILGYSPAELLGQNVKVLMPPPYRDEHDGYIRRFLQTRQPRIIGASRELKARRKDGTIIDVELAVSEVDHLSLFTGIIMDISRRKELEREVVEIASLEQRRVGQDLHDDVGQELTALGLLADSLVEQLRSAAPESVPQAERIEQRLRRSLQKVRNLARGLAVAEVQSEDLPAALGELTARLGETSGVDGVFSGDAEPPLIDVLKATHLYHIGQEACTNVLKHARAEHLEVTLRRRDHALVLQVRDDGIGLGTAREGLGQRIMHNRAKLIGATLTIAAGAPTGVLVTCVLPLEDHDAD